LVTIESILELTIKSLYEFIYKSILNFSINKSSSFFFDCDRFVIDKSYKSFSLAHNSIKFLYLRRLSCRDENEGKSFLYKKFSPALAIKSLELSLLMFEQLSINKVIDINKGYVFNFYSLGGL
jgi:hypothetical protein